MTTNRHTLRELLAAQADLYAGITREQWEVGREGGRLVPREFTERMDAENNAEKGVVEIPAYSEGFLRRRQAS